jgi:tRNA (guanine-N7-)-methyltransferase
LSHTKEDTDQRWYGRRQGKKLRPNRQALVDTLLPNLKVSPSLGEIPADLKTLFQAPCDDVWLEIGFGAGEHLAAQAANHPETGFIGCEPFINGVASLLAHIDKDKLQNVRVFDDDARILMDALPDACFGRIFVLFADPWPKSRHHRRRIMIEANLNRFARLLKNGGELRFASDHMEYASWTLERLLRHPEFDWLATTAGDWRNPPRDWVETRYETKARAKGDRPAYLRFARVDRRS